MRHREAVETHKAGIIDENKCSRTGVGGPELLDAAVEGLDQLGELVPARADHLRHREDRQRLSCESTARTRQRQCLTINSTWQM